MPWCVCVCVVTDDEDATPLIFFFWYEDDVTRSSSSLATDRGMEASPMPFQLNTRPKRYVVYIYMLVSV